jgi:hypothetical protein
MKNITVKVEVMIPTTFELEITDEKLWKKRKDEFFSSCTSEKDMGAYIQTDYCEEEYGVKIIDETIEEDHLNREFRDIIQTWDENGEER